MGLLQEIIESANDPAISVSSFLRRCNTLAYRLGHEPLKMWVDHELNGYPQGIELPAYRTGYRGDVVAEVLKLGLLAHGMPVPSWHVPAGQDAFEFREGVAVLEALVEGARLSGTQYIQQIIPVDLFASKEIYKDATTTSMCSRLPISQVHNLLEVIRTRAQTLALKIEAEYPMAGDVPGGTAPAIPTAQMNQYFTTTIWAGGSVNVAQGNSGSVGQTIEVSLGDVDSLMARLEELGVASDDRADLKQALAEDGATGAAQGPGEKTRAWLWKIGVKLRFRPCQWAAPCHHDSARLASRRSMADRYRSAAFSRLA